MRSTTVVLLLLLPSLALAQSLGDVAKKERERREKNKEQGKSAIEISEEDLYPEGRPSPEDSSDEAPAEGEAAAATPRAPTGSTAEYTEEELSEREDGDVPTFIPPDAPLEQRVEIFQRMRRRYESQVREIEDQIAKNEARISELDAQIGATSAAGGAGLPVAPQTGAGVANRQMTGQESETLVAEQNRLRTMNQQLAGQKEKLKYDLQQKGRAAGIPAGYLRF
jgi:hypothetical protein